MDRRLRAVKLDRSPGETLHQFAQRISTAADDRALADAADWYRDYATLRYTGQFDRSAVENLQQRFYALRVPRNKS